MRVARRTVLASTLAALATPAILRLARADAPPVVLKLHHSFSAVSAVHDKFLSPWARKVEADSGGRIRIDIFPSMQLGGAPAALFDQARVGDAEIVWASPRQTPGRFPKIETFELPFLPSRRALVSSKALQDFAALNLKDEFNDVHPLCFSCTDRAVIHSYDPVRAIEDLKDLKLHVQTRLAGEAIRALGAEPVPMPSEELPMAISQRVVDGCLDPWHLVPPFRLNDLLKNHTEFSDWSLSSTTYVLAMNQPAYDRLPRDLKIVLDNNSGQLAAGMAGTMWDLQAGAVAENAAQTGDVIVTLLPEAVAHWRKATDPVIADWLKDMKEQKVDGGKLVASAHALLAKYASLPEPQSSQTSPPPEQGAGPPQPAPAPQDNANLTAPPNVNAPAPPSPIAKPAPPAPAPVAKPVAPAAASPSPAPIAKPIAPSAPAPHPATQKPPLAPPKPPAVVAPAAPVATPATASAAPAAKPTLAPLAPSPPLPPQLTPAPAPSTPAPAVVPKPKALNIPL
jgi:TRAP-type C4-dicarboxylate transport system substrate-binding protein